MHAATDGLLARLCLGAASSAGAAATVSDVLDAPLSAVTRSDYAARLCRGGYPEVLSLSDADRVRWFESYVLTSVTRDIVEVTGARRRRYMSTNGSSGMPEQHPAAPVAVP